MFFTASKRLQYQQQNPGDQWEHPAELV